MPIIKSAIKKMRQDKKRTIVNKAKKLALKNVLKKAQVELSNKNLSLAFSALDKAAKNGLINKGQANRRKARLAKKIVNTNIQKPATKKATKKTKA